MNKLANIIAYITREYPRKHELSNARLTKMIYLADWLSANKRGCQISDIQWYFDNYGPFVHDVLETVQEHPEMFAIRHTSNVFGGEKTLVELKCSKVNIDLTAEERLILDDVINKTECLYWNDFIKLVYSTYPIISSDRYSFLDLIEKAKEYQEI